MESTENDRVGGTGSVRRGWRAPRPLREKTASYGLALCCGSYCARYNRSGLSTFLELLCVIARTRWTTVNDERISRAPFARHSVNANRGTCCIRGTQPAAAATIYPAWYVYARTQARGKRDTYVWHVHRKDWRTRGIVVVRSRVSEWSAGVARRA